MPTSQSWNFGELMTVPRVSTAKSLQFVGAKEAIIQTACAKLVRVSPVWLTYRPPLRNSAE